MTRTEKIIAGAATALVILSVLVLLLWFSGPAAAQSLCGQRADMINGLDGTYSETPSSMGLSNNGGVVEVLTSPEGKTWTIIITLPNGTSCLIAAGENWERQGGRRLTNGRAL